MMLSTTTTTAAAVAGGGRQFYFKQLTHSSSSIRKVRRSKKSYTAQLPYGKAIIVLKDLSTHLLKKYCASKWLRSFMPTFSKAKTPANLMSPPESPEYTEEDLEDYPNGIVDAPAPDGHNEFQDVEVESCNNGGPHVWHDINGMYHQNFNIWNSRNYGIWQSLFSESYINGELVKVHRSKEFLQHSMVLQLGTVIKNDRETHLKLGNNFRGCQQTIDQLEKDVNLLDEDLISKMSVKINLETQYAADLESRHQKNGTKTNCAKRIEEARQSFTDKIERLNKHNARIDKNKKQLKKKQSRIEKVVQEFETSENSEIMFQKIEGARNAILILIIEKLKKMGLETFVQKVFNNLNQLDHVVIEQPSSTENIQTLKEKAMSYINNKQSSTVGVGDVETLWQHIEAETGNPEQLTRCREKFKIAMEKEGVIFNEPQEEQYDDDEDMISVS